MQIWFLKMLSLSILLFGIRKNVISQKFFLQNLYIPSGLSGYNVVILGPSRLVTDN